MNREKFIKHILLILVISVMLVISNMGIVNGALQSNPNTHYQKVDRIHEWIKKIRQMEMAGETMGLSETLNDNLSASSESNNIDVHMIRATEYGATAILSASGYGNPKSENAIISTTGNDTGVMTKAVQVGEYVAGGLPKEKTARSIFSPENIDIRYYDLYDFAISSARIGDALGKNTSADSIINLGCANWHGASRSDWVSGEMPYFVRGQGGIFSYYPHYEVTNSASLYKYSRGVVVCGEGI